MFGEIARRFRRLLRSAMRVRLSTLLLVTAIVAILFAWRRDRETLLAEVERLRNADPRWGPDEATGAPDTTGFGDFRTAWASQTADGQREWLMLEFDEVVPVEIHIYETHCPGAVDEITRVNILGQESLLWRGVDPTPRTASGGVSKFPVSGAPATKLIKIYVDSPAVPGWNEIDAVALVDAQGTPHWARRATASSTYGPRGSLRVMW
jgi:hypothetical protein